MYIPEQMLTNQYTSQTTIIHNGKQHAVTSAGTKAFQTTHILLIEL